MDYFVVKFNLKSASGVDTEAVADVLASMAGDIGFESFETTDEGLNGYVNRELFSKEELDRLVSDFPLPDVEIGYTVEEFEQRDWNEKWEQSGFEPIVVGDSCLIYDPRHPLPESICADNFDIRIKIAPRMAFGSGTHETTQMLVEEMTERRPEGLRMLDCGCGTGILAIAAMMMGAREAYAYDIDEWSVENTRDNAAANEVRLTAMQGDASVTERMPGKFDLVIANINRNILLADMPAFVAKLSDEGELWLSGFYESDVPMLVERASSLGLTMKKHRQKGDWQALFFRR